MAMMVPPLFIIRYIRKLIKSANTNHLKNVFVKILGMGLLKLSLDMIESKNAPHGQRFQHHHLPLKKEVKRKKAIIATTR